MTLEGYPEGPLNRKSPKIFVIERFRSCWLVKVINTQVGSYNMLSIYINYFDSAVCIGKSFYIFEIASKFHRYNFQIENSTDVVLPEQWDV